MGENSLPKIVTRQRRDCDLNPDPSAPESSTLTTRLPSHPVLMYCASILVSYCDILLIKKRGSAVTKWYFECAFVFVGKEIYNI